MGEGRRVGVVHEHDILRRGIAGCLEDEGFFSIAYAVAETPPEEGIDAAVLSARALSIATFDCPVILFDHETACASGSQSPHVFATLWVAMATSDQLRASVRAAAAGLRVESAQQTHRHRRLDDRRLKVLQLLALGDTTRTISGKLCYSERTIKSLIRDVEYELSASSRAQAVAEAIRQGLI